MSDISEETFEKFLEHHGVKGQKWGIRRKKRPNPQSNGKFKPGNRAYDTRQLSNKDLKKVLERMKLEQQYADLNQKTRSKGKKFTEEVVQNTAKAAVGVVATAVVGHYVKEALKNKGAGSSKAKKAGKALGNVSFSGPKSSFG